MAEENIVEKFSEFLREFYYNELVNAVSEGKKSIIVDFNLLDKFDTELSDNLLDNPEEVLLSAEESIGQIDLPGEPKLKIRIFNLPESRGIRIRKVRAEHIGKLISIDGMVKRSSEIRPEVSEGIFECPDCGERIIIIQTERIMRSPLRCTNPSCRNSKGFKLVSQKLYDARWIVVEEPYEITSGERPSILTIHLKEDLTSPKMQNKTDPGNRIKVVGILKEMPRRIKGTRSRQMEIYLEANSIESIEVEWEEIEIAPDDEMKILELARDPEIYTKLVDSIAPALYGLEEIKEAVSLQLFGGEAHIQKDKSRVRGDVHILLVGDPSCLVGDERVIMVNGTVMKIGQMGSSHLQNIDYNVHMGMGRKVGRATTFHLYKKQPVIEIVTETRKSIRGTFNQPVLVLKNRRQIWRRLDEVNIGDRVQTLSRIECRKKSLVETKWRDYPEYHKTWHVKIPQFTDRELASIFGYIIADGWVQKDKVGFIINNDEIDIFPSLTNAFKNCFDAPVTTYNKKTSPKATYYQVCRTHMAKLLSFLNEKRVPDLIWCSGNYIVASFLAWLYEGDGSVFSKGRGRTSISLKSDNIELLRDVQLLLLRFGIHSRILWEEKPKLIQIKGRDIHSKPSGSLMIRRSESIIKFWKNIGFVSKKKKSKLEQVVEYAKFHVHRIHSTRSEKIVQINKLPPQDVFDIEVPEYQRFVANGIIVHNTAKSVLMKVVSTLIPRARYVSGKGVTGAGLTASVIRDEEFIGGWVLEAGALVMSNRSMIAIDEFEKIEKTDQIALHEAMELQSISIAKANIIATLPAQTAILGGGNPKFGRFDPYLPIKEQLDLPETILSRFDLKFALRDIPNPETDAKVADHILKARHFGEEEVKPVIEPDVFKKYVAYARKNCHPKLSREAGAAIEDFFLKLRERVTTEEAPIPISWRQYEAMIRLAEASAKVQLRDTVTVEDAIRAINLMKASLRQFGFEPETGKLDIDRAEGYTTSMQRSKIRVVLDVIEELGKTFGKSIPQDEVISRARAQGVDNADEMIRKMLNEGVLFAPKPNFIQKI